MQPVLYGMCTDPTLQERAKSFSLWKTAATPEREKERQRGSGAESQAMALWAEQGLYKQYFRAIVSQSEPESGKESQWKPEFQLQNTIRSQLVPEKDHLGPVRARESTREPERELERKPVSQGGWAAEWAREICHKLLLLTRASPPPQRV